MENNNFNKRKSIWIGRVRSRCRFLLFTQMSEQNKVPMTLNALPSDLSVTAKSIYILDRNKNSAINRSFNISIPIKNKSAVLAKQKLLKNKFTSKLFLDYNQRRDISNRYLLALNNNNSLKEEANWLSLQQKRNHALLSKTLVPCSRNTGSNNISCHNSFTYNKQLHINKIPAEELNSLQIDTVGNRGLSVSGLGKTSKSGMGSIAKKKLLLINKRNFDNRKNSCENKALIKGFALPYLLNPIIRKMDKSIIKPENVRHSVGLAEGINILKASKAEPEKIKKSKLKEVKNYREEMDNTSFQPITQGAIIVRTKEGQYIIS